MTTATGPPPTRNPTTTTTSSAAESQAKTSEEPSTSESIKLSMAPPPPKTVNPPDVDSSAPPRTEDIANSTESKDANESVERKEELRAGNVEVPYAIPPWSGAPCHHYTLEVLKDGSIIDQLNVNNKGAYMFGRVDLCDFVLEHPTISRFHAVIQFKSNGDAYLYDIGSTHGTFINKNQVKKKVYVELHVGDVIRFGHSSRLYILQGPSDLMPPETDLKSIRNAKIKQDMQDMEASLLRAKLDASLADGISWGMQEDAIEETEDEVDEVTWQTYKGQLTEKQEKTREKVLKRLEKIAHMKKEIDAIRAKDIAQGGLTQGQQTQIARNEQRMSQIMEELENLEETLNESIRESIGARGARTFHGKRKGAGGDDDEDYSSGEDEFYDRTQKPSKQKNGENQSIETADSLLDKREVILKEMEDKRKLLLNEDKTVQENEVPDAGDALDAYMTTVSSQLAFDKKEKLHKELGTLQSELDRVTYLLKIADPRGDAARKRELKAHEPTEHVTAAASGAFEQPPSKQNQRSKPEKQLNGSIRPEDTPNTSIHKQDIVDTITESSQKLEQPEIVSCETANKTTVYNVAKPRWLGDVEDRKMQENIQEAPSNMHENDQFVDYKDRKKILEKSGDPQVTETLGIENAAPGLIIRKRKLVEKSEIGEITTSEQSKETEIKAEDAVALLLKHSRGLHASDEELRHDNEDVPCGSQKKTDKKKPKRVLGPERPTFLSSDSDYNSWVPPEGQSGDGRTSLNDRLGY